MNRPFVPYFPKGGLCSHHAVYVFECLSVCEFVFLDVRESATTNFWTPEPNFMKFSKHII
jgi:hypothetical protein